MRMKLSADRYCNINGFRWSIQALTRILGARAPLSRGLSRSPFNMCFEFAKLLPHVKIP